MSIQSNRPLREFVWLLIAATLCAHCSDPSTEYRKRPQGSVTYAGEIAPIVHANCLACHRPDGPAPFSLVEPEQAVKRARDLAEVVESGFMPPWLPEPEHGRFEGERRLDATQIGLIGQWAEEGAPLGDVAALPTPPTFASGWQLGEPDLVVMPADPYLLTVEGNDIFINLVVPLPNEARRWVRAVELLPGNPRVVHHAVMQFDRGRGSRELAAGEPGPGFSGMSMGTSSPPEGHFLGWTPGRMPYRSPDGMAWTLHPDTDLVLQLHLLPSGKPETIQPQIGFYFTDIKPTLSPFVILLRNDAIDIPAGAANHRIERSLTIPVDVDLLGIYPHAHYLGKALHAYATLPGEKRRWMIRIDDWDFNWQEDYRLAEPLRLPAGTRLTMDYSYDNSAENARNPNFPPERVTFGNRSSDEMATLTLQVLPVRPADRAALEFSILEQNASSGTAGWDAFYNLGIALAQKGKFGEAEEQYLQALALYERNPKIHNNLGNVFAATGRSDRALEAYRRSLEIDPNHAAAHGNLAIELSERGIDDKALLHFRENARLDPTSITAQTNLALELHERGEFTEALKHFRLAYDLDPGSPTVLNGLALVLATHPDLVLRDPQRAIELAERVDRATGGNLAEVVETLSLAHASAGRYSDALREAGRALRLAIAARDGQRAEALRGRIAEYEAKVAATAER